MGEDGWFRHLRLEFSLVHILRCCFTYMLMAIGGLLYDNVSPQSPFLISALIIIPSIILTIFYVHEPRREEREVKLRL